jgi:aminopeptidase YwaD
MLNFLIAAFALTSGSGVINVRAIDSHVRFLASEECAGRMTLSPGIERAAQYAASQFKKMGLEPGPNGSYFHEYEVTLGIRATSRNVLVLTSNDGRTSSLELNKDFVPVSGSENMKTASAPIVFAGYGLADEDWNDYDGLDAKDKVVLVLRGAPEGRRGGSNGAKARIASEKGAVGILYAGTTAAGRSELPSLTRGQGFAQNLGMVGAGISSKVFRQLTGKTVEQAASAGRSGGMPLKWSAKLITETEPNVGKAKNVVAVLPGRHPTLKHEYVILGAHYDHVGMGEFGSRTGVEAIHFGADDNASGTAAVMALAEHFAQRHSNSRTILFQLYSGEELGLLGSRAWAGDPANEVILKNTTAMINLDMVGRLRDENLYVYGTSSAEGWDAVLSKVSVPGVKIVAAPNVRGDSDQMSFARKNVPVLFLHTGLTEEYHSEKDTVDTLFIPGIALVAECAAQLAEGLDKLPNKLVFSDKAVFGNRPEDRRIPKTGGVRMVEAALR